MEIYKTKEIGTFVLFDSDAGTKDKRIYSFKTADLNDRLKTVNTELEGLPEVTDKYLLEWAKEHYPNWEEVVMQNNLAAEKVELETILDLTKILK